MEETPKYNVAYVASAAPEMTLNGPTKLIDLVRCMRKYQKAYFAAKRDTSEKVNALRDAKYYEREVDELLKLLEAKPTTQLPLSLW